MKLGVITYGILDDLSCVCAKDNQPSLITQNVIAEMRVIGVCALKRGDAINVAVSIKTPET